MCTYWCGYTHTCLYTHGYLGQQLFDAARDGKTSEVAALLSNPEARSFINWQDERGHSPIFIAALCGRTDAVKELISAGCDINRATKDGWTPIFAAACYGKTDAVKELISAGCDINLANKVKQMTGLALALACLCFLVRVA